jgi:hypothetical protein
MHLRVVVKAMLFMGWRVRVQSVVNDMIQQKLRSRVSACHKGASRDYEFILEKEYPGEQVAWVHEYCTEPSISLACAGWWLATTLRFGGTPYLFGEILRWRWSDERLPPARETLALHGAG